MNVSLIDPNTIDWEMLTEALWPAIRQDPAYDMKRLQMAVEGGSALVFEVSDGAKGYWVIELNGDVAWTVAIAGKIDGGPKQRLKLIREAVDALERTLKMAGIKTHRICGRDWSAVLPFYKPYSEARNGLQKELI